MGRGDKKEGKEAEDERRISRRVLFVCVGESKKSDDEKGTLMSAWRRSLRVDAIAEETWMWCGDGWMDGEGGREGGRKEEWSEWRGKEGQRRKRKEMTPKGREITLVEGQHRHWH